MTDKIFAKGLICKRRENAPEFVVAHLAFNVDEFIEFLKKHEDNGWVNLDMANSRGGKMYAALDTWKPTQGAASKPNRQAAQPASDDLADDIPF